MMNMNIAAEACIILGINNQKLDIQPSVTVEGSTFICNKCGYRCEIFPSYPQRRLDIEDAFKHKCDKTDLEYYNARWKNRGID